MKILLLGKNGQVGWELQRSLAPLGEVVALDVDSTEHGADFTDPESLAATVRAIRPSVIVNAVGYTAVDQAEREPARALAINGHAPGVLAREAVNLDATLLHYSSDYVFDGRRGEPYDETVAPAPLNAYGRSCVAGEEAVRTGGCRHLIFRTSWVHSPRGRNFAATIFELARGRERLQVVDDQVGAPTGADLLADVSVHALRVLAQRPELVGTYHVAAAGATSRHRYARHVVAWGHAHGHGLRARPEAIEAVDSGAFPTGAERPSNSRLDTRKLRQAFGLYLPTWQQGVDRMLSERYGT